MKHYKIIIAYDGTDYVGWQTQLDQPTIMRTLQHSFKRVFHTPVTIIGASRTDAGVHAMGQVALCKTTLDLNPEQILFAWNNTLPADIVIRTCQKVDYAFHPHHKVDYKIYWYHFFLERPLPFVQRYGLYYRRLIDLDKLKNALHIFLGTHDFRSFCTGYEMDKKTVRTIDTISLEYLKHFNVYRISVKGQSFLRHMIRRIVGACLEVASQKTIPITYLQEVLAQKNPKQILPNAPAKGLLLQKIVYKGDK